MENMILNNKSFSTWAKETYTQYPEILEHMRLSHDILERVIAIRIIKNAGVSPLD